MKVLIVTSDFFEGEFLLQALKLENIEVCAVCSPDNVQHYCKEHNVGVIITFCQHNFFNGQWCNEFFDKLKGSPKIFLLSSIAHYPTVVSLYKGKVHQYYCMPVKMPRMIRNLAQQISKL